MHAIGGRSERDIDAVVDHEGHAGWRKRRLDRPRRLDHVPGVAVLVAQLHERRAALDNAPRERDEVMPAGAFGIDDGVEAEVDRLHTAHATAPFPAAVPVGRLEMTARPA